MPHYAITRIQAPKPDTTHLHGSSFTFAAQSTVVKNSSALRGAMIRTEAIALGEQLDDGAEQDEACIHCESILKPPAAGNILWGQKTSHTQSASDRDAHS